MNIKAIVEGLLFVSGDEGLTLDEVCNLTEESKDKITNIIESYSDILEMMKVYYQKQDYETSTMIKASNSELIREVEKK